METQIEAVSFTGLGAQCAKSQLCQLAQLNILVELFNPLDFIQWEAAVAEFKNGARNAGYLDAQSLWEHVTRLARDISIMGAGKTLKAKPKAETPKAGQVAGKRAEKAQAVTVAIAAGETAETLMAKARTAQAADDLDEASRLARLSIDVADKVFRDRAKAQKEATSAALKAAKARFDTALNEARKGFTVEDYDRLVRAIKPEPEPAKPAKARRTQKTPL